MTPYELIQTSAELRALFERWHGEPMIGVDTEFVRTDTYYSRPGLVQLGIDGAIALLDPIAVDDLTPLASVLTDSRIVKVMHSAAEDVSLLSQITGTPPINLFDTQIAAALCGYGASMSYRALVETLVGDTLEKGETRSDWCARPLSASQLRYAALDVHYLPGLWRQLSEELETLGRTDWATEDCATVVSPAQTPSFARVRGAARLTRRELKVLDTLAQWREKEAMARDRPRGHVVNDLGLLGIVQRSPTSRAELSSIEGVSARFVRRSAQEILTLLEAEQKTSSGPLPLPLQVEPAQRGLVDALRAQVRSRAEELGFAPEVIASRRQLEHVVVGATYDCFDRFHTLFSGWRGEVMGRGLEAFVRDTTATSPAAGAARK